jgi:hypothetical protein
LLLLGYIPFFGGDRHAMCGLPAVAIDAARVSGLFEAADAPFAPHKPGRSRGGDFPESGTRQCNRPQSLGVENCPVHDQQLSHGWFCVQLGDFVAFAFAMSLNRVIT